MKFEKVLPALREGKKIKRAAWDAVYYIFTASDGCILKQGPGYTSNATSLDNLVADDWEIVEEFEEVEVWDWVIRRNTTGRIEILSGFSEKCSHTVGEVYKIIGDYEIIGRIEGTRTLVKRPKR